MTTRPLLAALPLLVLTWLATLAAVAVITDQAPAYVVVFPSDALLANLPDDANILSASGLSVTLISDQESFARRLYEHGARLVLPAGLTGCLPMPTADETAVGPRDANSGASRFPTDIGAKKFD
ncbi:MAG: hypothetical protein MK160_04315 [Rhodobacteraceae bacterium]|nr:hypothetical protein [Paracoccaceae bacterium]